MARKITKQGHTVKGALAAYFAPRLAADKALKPGELDKLFQDEKLKVAPYKKQIPILVDAAKALTKDRLAKDADVEDLAELLEALSGEDLDEDFEEGEDKGLVKDEDDMAADGSMAACIALLRKCAEECQKHVDECAECAPCAEECLKCADECEAMQNPEAMDELPPGKKAVPFKKKPDNAAPMKEVPVQKPAMDAAIKLATDAAVATATKATKDSIAALFNAARDVEPTVGHIDALAFDSADAIYKMALDAAGIPTKDVHPSAYKTLLKLASERPTAAFDSAIAADSAAAAVDFEKQYTHIPAQA